LLDPYCIAEVEINPESRVKVTPGQAKATLMQEGWVTYLVKVYNQAGITAKLEAESPNAGVLLHRSVSDKGHRMKPEHRISPGELQQRFIELTMYTGRPLKPALSGLGIEYCVMQL